MDYIQVGSDNAIKSTPSCNVETAALLARNGKIQIRPGTEDDIDAVAAFYDAVCDHLDATVNYPGWVKGDYPTRVDAQRAIGEHALFLAEINGEFAGSIILRHEPEEAYRAAPWQSNFDDSEVFIIYTFAVNPNFQRRGAGEYMLNFAAQHGKTAGAKALRLDVYEKNLPAIHLYEKCGFRYINTVSLGLEDYGLDWFKLYEKLL